LAKDFTSHTHQNVSNGVPADRDKTRLSRGNFNLNPGVLAFGYPPVMP
jgi:hypothetical protein